MESGSVGLGLSIARALVLVAIVTSYLLLLRGWAPAQDRDLERAVDRSSSHGVTGPVGGPLEATIEALARVCVAEAGWEVDTRDCAAIVHVLQRRARARHVALERMVRLYSSRHFDPRRTDPRRWIADLRLAAERPDGWPSHALWEHHRARWLETIEHVRDVLRGELDDPCDGAADHWGMRHGPDLERARRAGWRLLDCGETRNAFWSVRGGQP